MIGNGVTPVTALGGTGHGLWWWSDAVNQGWELGLFRPNCENLAVSRRDLAATTLFVISFGLPSIFENLDNFWPKSHMVPHSKNSTLKMSLIRIVTSLIRIVTSTLPFLTFEITQVHGRRNGEAGWGLALRFEIFPKKVYLLSFKWEKRNFTISVPPLETFWKNPLVPPLRENPLDPHAQVNIPKPNNGDNYRRIMIIVMYPSDWTSNLQSGQSGSIGLLNWVTNLNKNRIRP